MIIVNRDWLLSYEITTGPYAYMTAAEKFKMFAGEKPEIGCWEWGRKRYKNHYGSFSINQIGMLAHKVSYQLFVGDIPKGIKVLHKCDNPPCIRPDHLFLGTTQDNAQDMIKKGRGNPPRGEKSGKAELNDEKVIKIRLLYSSGKYSQKQLGEMFGVSAKQISVIVNRIQWFHI